MELELEKLNSAQHDAVTADPGHLLVLAGAGSGKTRVLIQRMAWLIDNDLASANQMLAVTFTNKAAREMSQRMESVTGARNFGLWVGTFHGLCHRLLRLHWKEAGFDEEFQIIDADDQTRLVKRLLKSNEIDDKRWPAKKVCWYINAEKQAGRRAADIYVNNDYAQEVMLNIYKQYEEICERSSLADFSELLLRCVELLEKNTELREHYQRRFKHILIDEFQDINNLQYKWVKLLAGTTNFCLAVGDDDQSIYSWRGAEVKNLHRFQTDYPGCRLIRLEQNYRSTACILNAANKVIAKNSERIGKELWTEQIGGEKITLFGAFNEREEASFITDRIRKLLASGIKHSDIAIVYRANALSRLLEENLLENNIPYKVYGGHRFFERMEIKDALAYLRMVCHPNDDAAFERVINTPARGIGGVSLTKIREIAKNEQIPLWQAGLKAIKEGLFTPRASNALQVFYSLISDLAASLHELGLGEQCEHIIQASGLYAHYKKDRTEKGLSRIENLDELIHATREFTPDKNSEQTPLIEFLSAVSLETDKSEEGDANYDAINLMTLHSAKGLEFDSVFICGMEDGLFPHQMSINERDGLEEERRLCYVGMTRAKRKLFLSYAECRYQHGREQYNKASRFLKEIPADCLDVVRATKSHAQAKIDPYAQVAPDDDLPEGIGMGQRVAHPRFGSGVLVAAEGHGAHARVQVKFDSVGSKWLVLQYANLSAD
jgi:DNA helicase II / ATP-dependent DNA helicase PcrA